MASEQVRRNWLQGVPGRMFCKGSRQNILTRAPWLESCSPVHFWSFLGFSFDFWSFLYPYYILISSSSYELVNRREEYGFSMCQFALQVVNK